MTCTVSARSPTCVLYIAKVIRNTLTGTRDCYLTRHMDSGLTRVPPSQSFYRPSEYLITCNSALQRLTSITNQLLTNKLILAKTHENADLKKSRQFGRAGYSRELPVDFDRKQSRNEILKVTLRIKVCRHLTRTISGFPNHPS